jgi:hypothetical protein
MPRVSIRTALVPALILAASWAVLAQQGQPAGRGGRAGGTPAASPPAPPRDISGVWMMRNPPGSNRGWTNFTFTDPKADPPALTEWGKARKAEARDSNGGTYRLDETNDPVLTKCYPPGVPRVYFHPYPFEIIQTPREVLQIFEYDHFLRRIKTDGRALPTDPDLLWMGTSVGRWEGNDFVVETVGFNDRTWLDRIGHAHTTELKVTERFRRIDRDNLHLDITMEDPKALAKPWKTTFFYQQRAGWELGEISCSGDYLEWAKNEK